MAREDSKEAKRDDIEGFFGIVYGELRSLAGGALRNERPDHTLQPTALVHEVWLKLSAGLNEEIDREHFLATATLAMRQVLQDHARARKTLKRGEREQGHEPVDQAMDTSTVDTGSGAVDIVMLDDALSRLATFNAGHARIAELRILGGLTIPEVARVTDTPQRTVELDWKFARAWLRDEFGE